MSLGPLVRNRIRGQRSHTRVGGDAIKTHRRTKCSPGHDKSQRQTGKRQRYSSLPPPHLSPSLSSCSGTDCQRPLASGVIGSSTFRPPGLDRDSDSNPTFYSNSDYDSDSDSSINCIPILTASDLWLAVSLPVGATLHICPQADIYTLNS